ncbi:MAG: von Willebrand factor type A domain-containing protein [Prevotellaceae bacterium]|jgi:Ca-activated chloride channel family protein|nr:von Willebrand factor type A domain-containing protein [Prevotellaceae bacterium]
MKKVKKIVLFIATIALTACNYSSKEDNSSNFGETGADGFVGNEKYTDYGENPFILTAEQPVSTFSIDADGASYANVRRFLNQGQMPPKEAVRIEELVNYFTFNCAEPQTGENVSIETEISSCPWNTQHHLLRIGIKGKTLDINALPASNYVFLIDVSGSMNSSDKLGILKAGFKAMTEHLTDNDRIAIVTYAGSAGVVLQSTAGNNKDIIRQAIDRLEAGGSTAGAAGINTAYEIAQQNFIEGGNNRIILGTDGDFNVGISSNKELIKLIEEKRDKGIYLTVLGVGTGNLNDSMMEQIADHGDGNYEYIDNADEIQKVFVNEKLKLYTVAKDCKNQITFNPSMVVSYRLIGYENRAMKNEDFEKDTVDAGDLGSSQTVTAVYELMLTDATVAQPYGTFEFRYKMPDETSSRLISKSIENGKQFIESASENQRFAAAVTAFGLILKQSEFKGEANKQMVRDLAANAVTFDPYGYRAKFLELLEKISD